MAGELVPFVLMPRYTTLAGASTFTTIAMDVTEYQSAILNLWRGKLVAAGTIGFTCEESTDQNTWATCTGGGSTDPGEETEAQVTATLKKRWFRLKVVLTETDAQASVWVVGFLEQRQS